MMKEIDQRILQFYDNELDPLEKEQFLNELQTNDSLKQEWLFYGKIIEGIKAQGASDLKEYIKENVEIDSVENQSNLWMYAAATVTFLLLSYFAIYSYLETGNLKEATRIITLKDEKSKKFRFWKNRNKGQNADFAQNNLSKTYLDSLALLERDIQNDTTQNDPLLAAAEPEVVEQPPINIAEGNTSRVDNAAPLSMDNAGETDIEKYAILMNQIQLVSIKLDDFKSTEKPTVSTKSADEVYVKQKAKLSAKKEESISSKLKDSVENKSSKKVIPSAPQKFKLKHYESEISKPQITVHRTKQFTEVELFNIWGENPLVYEVNGNYYLDLGKNHIWKIPSTDGQFDKIEWIRDKSIIDKIRN